MAIFTCFYGAIWRTGLVFGFLSLHLAFAETDADTTTSTPAPVAASSSTSDTNAPATNLPAMTAPATNTTTTPEAPAIMTSSATVEPSVMANPPVTIVANFSTPVLCALLMLASMGGFLLYQCGLTRAKNSGHSSTLLLVGVMFAVTGYWIGGFGVQAGGVGDTRAALTQTIPHALRSDLNHELGPLVFGHHWGLMGSSGFFLGSERTTRNGMAGFFLVQAALLAISMAAALGASLERARMLAMALCAYLFGVLVYPLLANWVWGGGWLAEMGREFSLGNGFVDVGGAAVVHETAGIFALVIAVVLGPRHGRFGRNHESRAIPGHNVPFLVVGSLILLVSWMASNAVLSAGLPVDSEASPSVSPAGLAAINTLLAAIGGAIASFIQAAMRKQRPQPAWLCRGLLGGAVASCGCAGLIDPWAAFFIGIVAALLVHQAFLFLEQKRIDDPVGAAAVHGVGGAWGVIAVGLFADGADGGLNDVDAPVRGLFYGGAWHQLAAQIIGCASTFVVICLLGYACVGLVNKILGTRVDLAQETEGLDLGETGVLGYQGDVGPEE